MPNSIPSSLGAKELTALKDMLNLEALACKKAEHYTQTLTDPALQQMTQQLVNHHKAHFDALCAQLGCC